MKYNRFVTFNVNVLSSEVIVVIVKCKTTTASASDCAILCDLVMTLNPPSETESSLYADGR